MKESSEIDKLIPSEKTVRVAGEDVVVRKYNLEDIFVCFNQLTKAVSALQESHPGIDFGNIPRSELLPLVTEQLGNIAGLIGRAIGKDADWVMKVRDLAGVLRIVAAILDVNNIEELRTLFFGILKSAKAEVKKS